MLHRAIVYIPHPGGFQWPEVTVFFELPLSSPDPLAHLQALVAATWGVPAQRVHAYNITSEPELRRMWNTQPVQMIGRDVPLLQNGDGPDGPLYCSPRRTQYLVGPTWLSRLHQARDYIDLMLARDLMNEGAL